MPNTLQGHPPYFYFTSHTNGKALPYCCALLVPYLSRSKLNRCLLLLPYLFDSSSIKNRTTIEQLTKNYRRNKDATCSLPAFKSLVSLTLIVLYFMLPFADLSKQFASIVLKRSQHFIVFCPLFPLWQLGKALSVLCPPIHVEWLIA